MDESVVLRIILGMIAALKPLYEWFRLQYSLKFKQNNIFVIEPQQAGGENYCSANKKATDPRHSEDFFIQLHFHMLVGNICNINILNIELEYEVKGFPIKKLISINNKEQSLNSNLFMNQSYHLSKNEDANIIIKKFFSCKFADADNKKYKNAIIKIDLTSPAWEGKKQFARIGKLEPGGKLTMQKWMPQFCNYLK